MAFHGACAIVCGICIRKLEFDEDKIAIEAVNIINYKLYMNNSMKVPCRVREQACVYNVLRNRRKSSEWRILSI